MKMLITLESQDIVCSKSAHLYMYCTFERCLDTGVQDGDKASHWYPGSGVVLDCIDS